MIVVPSLVSCVKSLFPVRVVNFSTEDVWLLPRARLGTLCPVESMSPTNDCEVKFHRIAAGVEEITVNTVGRQETASTVPDFLGGTAEQQVELQALLLRYVNVFSLDDEELGFSESAAPDPFGR